MEGVFTAVAMTGVVADSNNFFLWRGGYAIDCMDWNVATAPVLCMEKQTENGETIYLYLQRITVWHSKVQTAENLEEIRYCR